MTKRIITPFAASGDKNTVPDTAPVTDDGYANYPDGFPPSNSVDPALGGSYVKRADFNGVMYDVTSILQAQAKGLMYTYDATYSTAIGGYPVDAILAKSGEIGFWLNITAGNTTNPDTGGAGWIDLSPKAIQNNAYTYADASGSTTAYTATYSPAIATLVDGMVCYVDTGSVGTNTTTTPTFSPNGLTAHTIKRQGGDAVKIGDVPKNAILQYDSAATAWILLNPKYTVAIATGITTVTTSATLTTSVAGGLVLLNSASAIAPVLPAAAAFNAGETIQFQSKNTGVATITRAGSDTITVNNTTVTSLAMGNGDTLTLMSDGVSTWYAVGGTAQLGHSKTFYRSSSGLNNVQFLPGGLIVQTVSGANQSAAGVQVVMLPMVFPNEVLFYSVSTHCSNATPGTVQGRFSITTPSTSAMWVYRSADDNSIGCIPLITAWGR